MTNIPSSLPSQGVSLPVTVARPAVEGAQTPDFKPAREALPVQATQAAQAAKAQPSAQDMKRISDELQRRTSAAAPELKFSIDQTSGRSIIKITDPTTNEVIRQIPTEEALQLNESLDRFQQGLLLNRKA